jgi:multicomponent Na+:H+ antiporter subunit C
VIVVNYVGAGLLFCLGLLAVLTRRDLIKIVMGLSIMEASTYLLIVSMAYRQGSTAPVLGNGPNGMTPEQVAHARLADPVLQNFCLTAIVIGIAVTAVFLAVAVRVAQHHRSVDAADMTALRG